MTGSHPRMPALDSDAYHDLVAGVASFGWCLGAALVGGMPMSRATFYSWRAKARDGVEPYATWMSRFSADVRATRSRRWRGEA